VRWGWRGGERGGHYCDEGYCWGGGEGCGLRHRCGVGMAEPVRCGEEAEGIFLCLDSRKYRF
jgi:hypothetical protein